MTRARLHYYDNAALASSQYKHCTLESIMVATTCDPHFTSSPSIVYIYSFCGIAFCPGQPNGYKCGHGFARLSYEGMSTQSVLTKGNTGQPVYDERAYAVSPFENGVLMG